MAETRSEKIGRLRRERNRKRKLRHNHIIRAKQLAKRIKIVNAAIKRLTSPDVPPSLNGWHPGAVRTQVKSGLGTPMDVPAKLVWHTTEGSSLPTYSGSHPHFTLNPKTGQLWQHIPIWSGAMTVRNEAGGVETNRANAKQVELIGFAKDTGNWPTSYYVNIARLARWIEKHGGVERKCSVKFVGNGLTNHLSGPDWLQYSGHLGHQHVPENTHWDPGFLRINEIV